MRIIHNEEINWKFLSALNRVTESCVKELLLAQISETKSKSDEHSEEKNQGETNQIKNILRHIVVKETFVRRWVASQERD